MVLAPSPLSECQCPHGLIPHCYNHEDICNVFVSYLCQCPHGLIPHCYVRRNKPIKEGKRKLCQCPHGLIPHCYKDLADLDWYKIEVSMPSRAYTSLLRCYQSTTTNMNHCSACQCPHGLIPHCYSTPSKT